jgi:hypothetical protein
LEDLDGPFRLDDGFVRQHAKPLIDPPMVAACDAAHMRDDDVVLGLSLHGEARAYPWWIMDNHHVVNDTVAGRAVMVILCEACCTAVAFDPVVSGRRLTFHQPYVYKSTIALEDHQTKSVWAPYYGKAIKGELVGTELEVLPLLQMEWTAWRALYPETLVLPGYLGERGGHGSAFSMDTDLLPEVPEALRLTWDDRLPFQTLVLGVVTPEAQRAYPLTTLRERGGVLNDDLGGVPIVAMQHAAGAGYGALAFSRILDGQTLSFARRPAGIVDLETASVWTAEGKALSGRLAGRQLSFVTSHVARWYVWAANYPDITIA